MICLITFSHFAVAAAPASDIQVKFRNENVNLLGMPPQLNEPAPIFRVIDDDFNPIDLTDFKGQTVLISSVPSLDLGPYAPQAIMFDQEVANFPDNVAMLAISTDLPFAQKRFSQQQNLHNLEVVSDSVWRDFGTKYGLLMKNKGLLARAIVIIDRKGVLRYRQLVKDVNQQPNYHEALQTLRKISSQAY